MKYEKLPCSDCGKVRWIVNKTKCLCSECNSKRLAHARKKQKKLNPVSFKMAEVKMKYAEMCREMDNDRRLPKVCSGCGKPYIEVKLSHSHLISRQDCHNLGRMDLIYDRRNVVYHCMSIGEHVGCHEKWESKRRIELFDYQKNIEFISSIDSKLYFKYRVEEHLKTT